MNLIISAALIVVGLLMILAEDAMGQKTAAVVTSLALLAVLLLGNLALAFTFVAS